MFGRGERRAGSRCFSFCISLPVASLVSLSLSLPLLHYLFLHLFSIWRFGDLDYAALIAYQRFGVLARTADAFVFLVLVSGVFLLLLFCLSPVQSEWHFHTSSLLDLLLQTACFYSDNDSPRLAPSNVNLVHLIPGPLHLRLVTHKQASDRVPFSRKCNKLRT